MVSLPFGVEEVMYYAAAVKRVILCKEPVRGPDSICGGLWGLKIALWLLKCFVPDLFRVRVGAWQYGALFLLHILVASWCILRDKKLFHKI